MIRIIIKTYLLIFCFTNLFAYEISADTSGNNYKPYADNSYIEISVSVGNEAIVVLKGSDPENDKIYFILSPNAHLQYGSARIDNGKKFVYTSRKDIPSVTKRGQNCNDPTSICDFVKYKIKDSKGNYSEEYTVNIRIQEPFDMDNYDQNNKGRFNARSFRNHMDKSLLENRNSFMHSDEPTEGIAQSIDKMFSGSYNFASSGDNKGKDFSNTNLKKNNGGRRALLRMQGPNGTLAQNNTILDKEFYKKMQKLGYRHHSITEQSIKVCRIERAGGVLRSFFVCPYDIHYPDNLSKATLFRAAYGEEDKAQTLCENSCFEASPCNTPVNTTERILFEDLSVLTLQDAIQVEKQLKDQNVTKIKFIAKDSEGGILKEYEKIFAAPIDGNLFHWHYEGLAEGNNSHISDLNQSSNENTVPGTNVKFKYDVVDESRSREAYSFHASRGKLSISVPRFFWIAFDDNLYNTKPKDNVLYTVIATIKKDMYRCPINSISNPSELFENKSTCNANCFIASACAKNTYVEMKDMDNISNYCKDMTIKYENQDRSLEYLTNEGKCKIYEESVVDFSNKHLNYFIRDFNVSDAMRPFGTLNDNIIEFPTKTSELVNENVISVIGSFQDMFQSKESINKIDNSFELSSRNFVDLHGGELQELFYPFSILLYSGLSNAVRQVGIVVRPNPKEVVLNKDHSIDYGFVAIAVEPEIRNTANSNMDDANETTFRYYLIDRDGNKTLLREEKAYGSYNRNTMGVDGSISISMQRDEPVSNFKPIIYNSATSNDDLDNAYFNYQFIKNANFLDNHEAKLFIYYETLGSLNNKGIQTVINEIKLDFLQGKKYLAIDNFHVNEILQTRQDVKSITTDKKGNYIVNFDSKEKYYGKLGPTFKRYLEMFPGNSDTPSFLFDETQRRDDSVAISRRGVDVNMSIDIKISPDINESKNGYYFAYLKKDNDPNAYFIMPVSTDGNYISEDGKYQCGITNVIFDSSNSCESYCTESKSVVTIDEEFSKKDGICTLNGMNGNSSGVLYSNKENCIRGSTMPPAQNVHSNIVNARLRFFTEGQPLNWLYGLDLKRSATLDYSSKIARTGDIVSFGDDNIININGLKNNEKLIFNFESQNTGDLNFKYIGLGIWNFKDVNKTLGREPLSTDIYIDSKINSGVCFDIQKYYNGSKLYFEVDKDFDGVYEESVAIMEPFICKDIAHSTLELKIEFIGSALKYDYIAQNGYKEKKDHNFIYEQKGNCRILDEDETKDNIDNNLFASKWEGVLPDGALTTNVFGAYKYGQGVGIKNLSELNNTKTGKIDKIFLKKVDIRKFKKIIDSNITELQKFILHDSNSSLMPIPMDSGVYKEDRSNFMIRQFNATFFKDYKMYAGYGHEPWDNCLNFKSPITVNQNLIESSEPPTNGCLVGYLYNSTTENCKKPLIPNYNNEVCPGVSEYNADNKRCEIVNISSFIGTYQATNSVSEFNIVKVKQVESFYVNGLTNGEGVFSVTLNGTTIASDVDLSINNLQDELINGKNTITLSGDVEDVNITVKFNEGVFNVGDGIIEIEKELACPKDLPNEEVGNICHVAVDCDIDGYDADLPSDMQHKPDYYPDKNACISKFLDPCTDYGAGQYDNDSGTCQRNTTEIIKVEKNVRICKPWWIIERVYKCDPEIFKADLIENRLSFGYPRRVEMCKKMETVTKSVYMKENGDLVKWAEKKVN